MTAAVGDQRDAFYYLELPVDLRPYFNLSPAQAKHLKANHFDANCG